MEKSFQTKEQLSEFFTTLSRGASPEPGESADISTSAATTDPEQLNMPTPSLPSELDSHTIPQEVLPYRFTGKTTDTLASPVGFERARGAEIYATMPRRKPRPKIASSQLPQSGDENSSCLTPVSPKKQINTGSHSRSAAARRAEGFSELLQFTRQQQFTPLGDMDVAQSLPSFARGRLSLGDTRGIPILDDENEDRLCNDFGDSGSVNIATMSKASILPQPGGEILDNSASPGQEDSNKVSTVPQLQAVPESSESLHDIVEEANGKAEFAISPPLGDSDPEKEDRTLSTCMPDDLEEKSETIETSDHEKEDTAPSICITTDDLEEKSETVGTNDYKKRDTCIATDDLEEESETVETSDHEMRDTVPSILITGEDLKEKSETVETNASLELTTSPPVIGREVEMESEKSNDVVMPTESLEEKSKDDEMMMDTSHKPEETNGRGELISPPLADDDDDKMEEKELVETARASP